jgi:uncharacterized membrane protein YbaN (DUF454 family)
VNSLSRVFLISAGTVNVGLGVLGIFVPLMPSTVFFLMAAACYVRSSPTLYNRLITHPKVGPLIYNYRTHRAMPRQAKKKAIAVLWITLAISAALVQKPVAWIILACVFVGVTWLLLSIKTLEDLDTASASKGGDS